MYISLQDAVPKMFSTDTMPSQGTEAALLTEAQSTTPGAATQRKQVIVFAIGNYLLALPLTAVLKVMNYPSIVSSGSSHELGLLYIGQAAIKLLNLQQLVSGKSESVAQRQFLIILQASPGELYGIPVDNPPDLAELPLATFRVIPESHRQSSPLGMASHAAFVTEGETTSTIFLLDLKRVLSATTTSNRNI